MLMGTALFCLACGMPRIRVGWLKHERDVSMNHDVHQVRSFEHPGEGRRRAKSTPKGRQVDPQATEEIAVLLGDRPRRRDLLIEHLHLIQDKYRQISAAHLAALADEMAEALPAGFEAVAVFVLLVVTMPLEAAAAPLSLRV